MPAIPAPSKPAQPQMDPMELLKMIFGQQQQGPDLAALAATLHPPDIQGNANRLAGLPSYAQGSLSPFNTGFFNADRGPIGAGPHTAVSPRTDVATNPFAFGPVGPGQEVPNPWVMPQPMPQGPFQGMIDPSLPDAQKYQDPNFFSVMPGQTTLPPGAVIGDETGARKKKSKPGNFALPSRSPFAF